MSFFRKAILVNSTALVCFMIRLGQTIILTRLLGPTGIGQYAVITAALMLAAQISALGFPIAFLYYSQHEPQRTREYQINCIWASLFLGLIGGSVMAGLLVWRKIYFGEVPWYAVVGVGLYILFMVQAGVARNSLLRHVESKRLSWMTLSSTLGSIVLVIGLAVTGRLTVGTALLCFTGLQLIRMAVGWSQVGRDVDWRCRPSLSVMRTLGLMGLRQGWVDIMVLVNATINIIILKVLITDFDQIGYFSRGMQIAMLVVTASQAVLPLLFSRWAGLEEHQLALHFEKVMRFVTTFSLIVILGILIAARPLVLLMFGEAFLPAVVPMMILLPGTLLYLLSKVVIQFLGSRGLPEVSGVMLTIGCAVNAALSWWLIPQYGINGAATASSIGNLTLLVLLMVVVVVKFRVHLLRCLCVTGQDCRNLVHSGVPS